MATQFLAVLLFIVLGTGLVLFAFIIGALIRRKGRKSLKKNAVYECGEPTIGQPWVRFNNRFYNIVAVFLFFNVAIALLIPFVLAFRNHIGNNGNSFGILLVFLFFFVLLILGFAYEWINGNLDWDKETSHK